MIAVARLAAVVWLIGTVFAAAHAQTISAPVVNRSGPSTSNAGSFGYTAGGNAVRFRFDPSLGTLDGRVENVNFQIHNGLSGPPLFTDLWADCPPGPSSPATVTVVGTRRITCAFVSVSAIEIARRVTVEDINGAVLPSLTGVVARVQFDIPSTATSGSVAVNIARATYDTSAANNLTAFFSNGALNITVPPIPPALTFAPSTGTTIAFPVQEIGTSSDQVIDLAASGGQGGATVTLACPAQNSPLPAGISVAPGTQTLLFGTAAQDLTLGCVRGVNAITGTLNCTESTSTGGSVTRSWPISCPAGTVPNLPPTLAYNPGPGSTVNLSSGPIGQTATGSIALNASSPGSGNGSVALACTAHAGVPQVIYADSLQNGWDNFSYGGGSSFANATPVFAGTQSIAFDGNNFNAVAFALTSGSIAASAFPRLRFFVHGGASGGQQLRLNVELGGASIGNVEVDAFITGGAIAAGQWREVVVPLSATNPPVTGNFDRVELQSDQAAPQSTLYIDSVSLLPPDAPSTITSFGTQNIAVGTTPQPIGLACVRGNVVTTATLSCTEFDTPGSALRLREWPVLCPGGLAARYGSDPRPNSVLANYRSLNQDFLAATLAITNTGNASLVLSNCVFAPAGGFGLAGPTTILAGQSGALTLSCGTPAIGTTQTAFFSCQTNDPDLATVLYRADCVAPPLANQGTGASQLPRLSSPQIDAGALLGSSASAAATLNGAEVIAVGAPNGGVDGAGRVYVFVRAAGMLGKSQAFGDDSLGTAVATLAPPLSAKGGAVGDKFGTAVSVAFGGTRIAVGAPDAGGTGVGQVFIYDQPPGGWSDLGTQVPVAIEPPPLAGIDGFGAAVQFSDTGALVIGAPTTDIGTAVDAGAAFVFAFSGGGWQQSGPMLTPTASSAGANFGSAIDTDAGRIAIGSPGESSQAGAAYLYALGAGGATDAARFTANDASPGDKFGSGVAIAGGIVAVGAAGDDTSAGTDSGSVSVLTLAGSGTAPTFTSLLMPEVGAGQAAGTAVATNGNVVLVGAPLADNTAGADAGRAYAYALPDLPAAMETADGFYENTIGGGGDRFGSAIAIGARRAIIGAPFGNEGNAADEGRADPFLLDGIFRAGLER
jgi:hypothetical protein